jgi:TP901 family phage tail tape measure protein
MQPILESLKEFRALVIALDNSPTGRISKEMQILKTSAIGVVTEMEQAFSKLPQSLEKQVAAAAGKTRDAAKKAGREAGSAYADGMLETVQAAKIRISVPSVTLSGGAKASLSANGTSGLYDLQAARKALEDSQLRDALVDQFNLAPALANKSARESAEAFKEAFATESMRAKASSNIDVHTLLGLTQPALRKSAEASALVFKEAFSVEAMKGKAASNVDVRTLLGLSPSATVNSAKASAETFKESFAESALKGKAASNIDVQTLLGLTPLAMRKSAESSASVFRESFAMAALKGKAASNVDVRTLLGLQPDMLAKSAASSADVFKQAFEGVNVGASPGALSEIKRIQDEAPKAAAKLDSLNTVMRDGHSAARGLASGFNAMWLTWGALGPLLAGAALSNAFTGAIQKGGEFEQRLASIRYLGGESAASVSGLASAALDLSRSGAPMGPVELAGALKTLSLAGLDAKEQLSALRPVMNFSIAGELPVEQAAESLVAISTAFGYTADGFGSVADVISKAAAISMSSVASMTESFKVASTVAQQYGVSVEDAATSLALLSQVGIRGQAAGTAMRNMYTELMGTSKKARKVLEETLDLQIFDNATKSARPLIDIFEDMSKGLAKLDFSAQQKALQDLGNERGLKALSANLMAINQQAKEMGSTLPNRLAEIRKQLEDAPGFAATAAVGMALTTQNQIKSVFASLEASLVESFGVMSPEIQRLAVDMRELFNSEEFRGALQSLVGSIADFTRMLMDNRDVLAMVAVGYLTGKAALIAYTVTQVAASSATVALNAALTATGVAGGVAAAGVRAVLVALGPIGALVAALGTAYLLMADNTETALAKATFAVDAHYDATVEGLDRELDRLAKEKTALEDGLSGKIAAAQVQHAIGVDNLKLLNQQRVATAQLDAQERLRQNQILRRTVGGDTSPYAQKLLADIDRSDREASEMVSEAQRRGAGKVETLQAKYDAVFKNAKQNAKLAAEIARTNRNIPTGPEGFESAGGDSGREKLSEYDKLAKKLRDEVADAHVQVANAAAGYTKAEIEALKVIGSPEWASFNITQRQTIANYLDELIAAEEVATRTKMLADVKAAMYRSESERQAETDKLRAQLTAEAEALANVGLSTEEVTARRYEATAAQKEFTGASLLNFDVTNKESAAYLEQANILRELADLTRQKAASAANDKLLEDAYKEGAEFWKDFSDDGKQFFFDLAENGDDAFKNLGKSLKREVLDMLYEMTVKQWVFQISGQMTGTGGAGGGTDWISMAAKAYDWYTGGTTASTAASTYSLASGASTGTGLTAGGGTGLTAGGGTGLSYTASTTTPVASTGTTAAASSSWMGYMGYAALIAAAVMVAENLYDKGYSRAAVGHGEGETGKIGSYSSYTSDPSMGKSTLYEIGIENFTRSLYDMVGVSEKWADILSGTTRAATLFGRKLSGYGLEADIAGGDADVSGYATYKGGLFRSNKTVDIEIDPRDAAMFDAQVESVIEGSRAMARAMGYNESAIDSYTGSLQLNLKGADTAEEQAERLSNAMADLQYSLLKAAKGGNLAREEFDKMLAAAVSSAETVGISTQTLSDTLVNGMMQGLGGAQTGAQMADLIAGGIINALAQNYTQQVAGAFMSQIITPVFTAILAGVPISQAVSQSSIESMVSYAHQAADALNAVLNDPAIRDAIARIGETAASVGQAFGSISLPSYGGMADLSASIAAADEAAQAAAEIEQQRYDLETELLSLLGDTTKLRERELSTIDESNWALQQQIWALEDAQSGMDDAMAALERAVDAEREILEKRLEVARELESSLGDMFKSLQGYAKDLRYEVDDAADLQADQARLLLQTATSVIKQLDLNALPQLEAGEDIADVITKLMGISVEDLEEASEALVRSVEDAAYASRLEKDQARLMLANELEALSDAIEPKLSETEQLVQSSEDQLVALDSALELAQSQLDALNNVDTSVKSVTDAVAALSVAMETYSYQVALAAGTSTSTSAPAGYTSSGSSGSSGGYSGSSGSSGSSSNTWTAQGYWDKNPDLQAEFTNANLENSPEFNKDPALSARDEYLTWHYNTYKDVETRKFARGGYYPGGRALVGEEGPELIDFDQPGRIYTAEQTAAVFGGAASTETADLLRTIVDRLDKIEAASGATAVYTGRTSKTLRRVTRRGNAMLTEPAA